MAVRHGADKTRKADSRTSGAKSYVQTSSGSDNATKTAQAIFTNVQAVEPAHMAHTVAVSQRRHRAATPLIAEAWSKILVECGLLERHQEVVRCILKGFNIGFLVISTTYAPFNSLSITNNHSAFNDILMRELERGRYLGPMSQQEVERLIGSFQLSLLSLIPKAGKPGKF
jgi:hypothetical protein